MPSEIETIIKEARELLAKATPFEWWVVPEKNKLTAGMTYNVVIGDQDDRVCRCRELECNPKENADFIAFIHNHLAEILDDRDRLAVSEDLSSGCFHAIRQMLSNLGCICGDGDHAATPPMMFDDWIRCTVAKRERRIKQLESERDAAISRAEAAERDVERLKQRVLTAAGDDLCRLTQDEIKALSSGAVQIPPEEEFIASCRRFHAQIADESGVLPNCLTLAQMIAENERLRSELAELKDHP